MNRPRRLEARDYTVGWICALPIELAAAQEMLDEVDEPIASDNLDPNHTLYNVGRIGVHNVVIASLPAGSTGTQSAATVATRMKAKFTSIRFGLMVGIGGGVPSAGFDIRLGDVVISQPYQQHGGVVQYDFGKTVSGGQRIRTGWLNAPPPVLLSAIVEQQARQIRRQSNLESHLSRFKRQPYFSREAAGPDVLFQAEYEHAGGPTCELCANAMKIWRPGRPGTGVGLHYGTIASGNQVIKDGVRRDQISKELGGVMCFEMEAAGLMNDLPCLVIRGICDYADSHKNKTWQPYAAATAAACAKDILSIVPGVPGPFTARPRPATESGKSRIEIKLDQLMKELQLGYKFPAQFVHDLKTDLIDDNITEVDVEENRDFIDEWLRTTEEDGWLDERERFGRYESGVQARRDRNQSAENYESVTAKDFTHSKSRQAYCETEKSDDDDGGYDDSDHFSEAETEVPDDHLAAPPTRHRTASPNPHPRDSRWQPPVAPEPKRNPIYAEKKLRPQASDPDRRPMRKSRQRRHQSMGREEGDDEDRYGYRPRPTDAYNERRYHSSEVPERPRINPFHPSYENTKQGMGMGYSGNPGYQTDHNEYPAQYHQRDINDRYGERFSDRTFQAPPRTARHEFYDPNPDPHAGRPPMSDYRQHGGAGPYQDPYQQTPPPHPLPGETKSFYFEPGGRPIYFNFGSAKDIFSEFLKDNEGIYPGMGRDPKASYPGMEPNPKASYRGMGPDPKASAPRKEITIVEKPLPLSLEELFRGVHKKLKISRKTYDISTGRQSTQDRVLEVPVKKGLKPGSKIKFADIGDQTAEGTQDMHFIITEVGERSSKLQAYD